MKKYKIDRILLLTILYGIEDETHYKNKLLSKYVDNLQKKSRICKKMILNCKEWEE